MWRPAGGTLQQPGDALLQDRIGWQTDGLFVVLGLQQFVNLWVGECGIATEVAALHPAPVARDHRFEQFAPAIGRMHIAGPQGAALQVAELVEHEQRQVRP